MQVTLKVEKDDIDRLKELAREISFRKNEDVTYASLIRKSISEFLERGGNAQRCKSGRGGK